MTDLRGQTRLRYQHRRVLVTDQRPERGHGTNRLKIPTIGTLVLSPKRVGLLVRSVLGDHRSGISKRMKPLSPQQKTRTGRTARGLPSTHVRPKDRTLTNLQRPTQERHSNQRQHINNRRGALHKERESPRLTKPQVHAQKRTKVRARSRNRPHSLAGHSVYTILLDNPFLPY